MSEIQRRARMVPTQIDNIIEAISKGAGDTLAAQCGGVTRVTLFNWRTIGKEENERRENGETPDEALDKYVDFHKRYIAAKGAFGKKHLDRLDKTEDPKISLAILARKYANDGWAEQPRRLEVTGRNGGDIKMLIEPLAPTRIMSILPVVKNDFDIRELASGEIDDTVDADFEEVS